MKLILDTECYPNFFSVQFKNFETGKMLVFVKTEDQELDIEKIKRLMGATTIGFNSLKYDLPLISYALMGVSNEKLKAISDDIIQNNLTPYKSHMKYGIAFTNYDHIDLQEVAPGVMISLKLYGGRLNAKKLQDLPFDPNLPLTKEQIQEVINYCENDLDTTYILYKSLIQDIELREAMSKIYGTDFRSKGGAQIAKAVLTHNQPVKYPKFDPNQIIRYKAPPWVNFKSSEFQSILKMVQSQEYILKDTGHIVLPSAIIKTISFDGAKYKMGIGGLHSQEKSQVIEPLPWEYLQDWDVVSFYPSMIINEQWEPEVYRGTFKDLYKKIYDERIVAKATKNMIVSNSHKLTLNSSFGLFGNKYSPLYEPKLMLATTLTGQLALLMLIEMLSLRGIKTKSANTDGILIYHSQIKDVKEIIAEWESITSLTMENTDYKAAYFANVNNYFVVKKDGRLKTKGYLSPPGIVKNPSFYVSVKAAIEYILHQTPIKETLMKESSIVDFLTVAKVTGGAQWKGEYLGKTVRFYWAKEGEKLTYVKNGNKVPKSDGAKPLMTLPDGLPNDIDYDAYEKEAWDIVTDLGLSVTNH